MAGFDGTDGAERYELWPMQSIDETEFFSDGGAETGEWRPGMPQLPPCVEHPDPLLPEAARQIREIEARIARG